MNKFFVPDNIYKDRIAICKSCDKYLSLLGNCSICKCFMKVKARLAPMECADNPKKWQKTIKIETPKHIPQDILEEIFTVYPDIKSGRAKDREAKTKMITLYNVIHGTNYKTKSNCSSCLSICFNGIKAIYNKYKK